MNDLPSRYHTVRKRITVACATVIIAASSASQGQTVEGDVVILQSDERSLVFEYRPQYTMPRTIREGNVEYVLYEFDRAMSRRTRDNAGSPDLRYRSFPIGLPSETGNGVQVIAADYEDMHNVLFAPLPSLRLFNDFVDVKGYEEDPQQYSRSEFLPGDVAELVTHGRNRSMILGSVHLNPLQYDPSRRMLRKYSRIVVEVVYASAVAPRVRNDDDIPFKNTLLNYDVARSWKFGDPQRLSRITGAPSVLASGTWYKLTVADEGMYLLSAQFFASAGINLTGVDPRTIKIYGNGGRMLPEHVLAPRPQDLMENAIHVEGESDGRFDANDYVLFYAKGARGTAYDSIARTMRHYINLYSEVNYYWLTVGGSNGKRMQQQSSVADPPALIPDRFTDIAFVEDEKVNLISSGKEWLGQSLNPGASFTYLVPLPGLIPNSSILYRYTLVARSESVPTFTARESGTSIGTHNLGTVFYSSDFGYATWGTYEVRATVPLTNSTSQLNFSFTSPSVGASGWIDWVEILYPRNFNPVNNYLRFRSPDTTAIVEYRLGTFSSIPWLFNVTDHSNVTRIPAASMTFRASERAGRVSEYCAAAPNAWKVPIGIVGVPNQNLRGFSGHIDFIILTSQEFASAANRLKAHREDPRYGNLRTMVVDVSQIYNEFGGGLPDITAVRDFLKYAYDNWDPGNPLRFVLMFGGGSYDYKHILGSKSSYVPTWQGGFLYDGVWNYSTDDYFAQFGTNAAPWLSMGRLSPRLASEAEFLVDKVIGYDKNSAQDSWKARILFVGDDSWTPEREEGTLHSAQAEQLAELFTPDEFEKRKIYLAEYPTVNTSQGRRKPGAYQAIIDEINRGVLIVNYTGHGNPTVWAHEAVFSVQTSIPQLVNANKLAVFFGATCNFSQFDDPKRYTGSELLMNRGSGGAIGSVSATRKVFSQDNALLNQRIFERMFSADQFGRIRVERVATAMYLFKAAYGNSVNDQKFFFMGDPSMRLQFPRGYASIDTINSEPVDSVNGGPRVTPIQLKALARVTLKGTIRDESNRIDSAFNGKVSIVANDASRRVTIVNFSPGVPSWSYIAVGGTIYRGENSVATGRFSATFIVPKDISYADSTTRGRLVAYFSNSGGDDGFGYTSKVRVGGTDATAALDTSGPSINIFLDSRGFRAGDMVSERPILYVDLVDSSGINTSGSGIGHRIEAWLNNSAQSRDITEFYTSKMDSYQEGTVTFQLSDLPAGRNDVSVRAWDTYNNASSSSSHFVVTSTEQLRISDVMNYPNPFAGVTSFTFRQNQLVPLNVTIKVYTLAGRLIQVLESYSPGEPFIRVPWDGRDRDGDVIANGVYLYKLIVRTVDGRFSSEALGKLAVLK